MGTWVPSTVKNGIATMGFNFAPDILDPTKLLRNKNQFVPAFGLFGGPGYLAGHLWDSNNICIDDPNIKIEDIMADWVNIPPAKNSSDQYSLSDTAYKAHDLAYYQAEGHKRKGVKSLHGSCRDKLI
jgi:hypothetical protein